MSGFIRLKYLYLVLLFYIFLILCYLSTMLYRSENMNYSQLQNSALMTINGTYSSTVTMTDNTIASVVQEELKALLQCNDKNAILNIQQQQGFYVLENYIMANRRFKCHESVTLTTQGDLTFLDNLMVLVEKWQGPVSVALYAPGYDFQSTLDSIAYLRNCQNDSLIKEFVTFHVLYDYKHQPKLTNTTVKNAYVDNWSNCSNVPYVVKQDDMYKHNQNLTYPINVARNLARKAATTHFIFPSDIELYPSQNFIKKFLDMILDNPSFTDDSLKVFVLPLFEIVTGQLIPQTKSQLQKMVQDKKAFSFHVKLCNECHMIPKFREWLKEPENDTLAVFTSTKRLGSKRDWEPFYVGTNIEPWFDERLTWEGQENKMVQGFIMCLMDYDFLVLDNAFLIHKPGVKKSKVQLQKHKKIISATQKDLRYNIRPELLNIYGRREGCQWLPTPKKKS